MNDIVITIFKRKQDIPNTMEYIELNELYFVQNTVALIDERAREIIEKIDGAHLVSKYKIRSRFNAVVLDIDKLSTGCKTVLNVLYYPDKVFCIKECGNNALELLYTLNSGNVYSEYPLIPLSMHEVMVQALLEKHVIDNYDDLKEWWEHEE